MATAKKPSGVKSESAAEAKQERSQNARLEKLEKAFTLFLQGRTSEAAAFYGVEK